MKFRVASVAPEVNVNTQSSTRKITRKINVVKVTKQTKHTILDKPCGKNLANTIKKKTLVTGNPRSWYIQIVCCRINHDLFGHVVNLTNFVEHEISGDSVEKRSTQHKKEVSA